MKRIEFIAPVEAIRGNISGAQKLQYAENNNPAYDGPVGSVNYARNYSPRFIGAKRAKDGLKYFSVRTKTANHLTPKAKKAMALMGGTGAIIAAILRDKTTPLYVALYAQFLKLQEYGSKKSFRKTLTDLILPALKAKQAVITLTGPNAPVSFNNPWVSGGTASYNVTISSAILVKFWSELANDPVLFTVDGRTGVAHGGAAAAETFAAVIAGNHNVLGLSLNDEGTGYKRVKLGNMFVTFVDNDVTYNAVDTRVISKQAGDTSNTITYELSGDAAPIWDD